MLPRFISEPRRWSFFDHLLVATLHGAIPFAQRHHVAAAVAENLHFDVPRLFDELFDEHAALTEIAGRKALDSVKRSCQLCSAPAQLHTDTATTGGALQHDGVADGRGSSRCILDVD
jgi:hypothetical protein